MFSLQYTELRTRVSKKMCLVNVSPESKEEKKDITDWYPISIYVYNLSNHYFEELISLAIQFLKLLKELQLYTASWYRPFSKPYNSTSDCWPQMQPIWIKPKKKNEKKKRFSYAHMHIPLILLSSMSERISSDSSMRPDALDRLLSKIQK